MAAPKSSRPMEKIHATANVGSRSGRPFYAAVVGQWRQPIATADVYSDYVQEAPMRLIACVTTCLVPILAAAQMAPKLRPTVKRIVLIAVRTFIPIRVSPAKAAINSDRAIAGKQTGALLPCQERSASHRPARSNYRLKTEFPRAPRLAADARPQPSAHNVHFGAIVLKKSGVVGGRPG
jgi:hypothetical protein